MRAPARQQLRWRLTFWYVCVFAVVLAIYVSLVFAFQYAFLKRQMFHDELQDVETVEGLLSFNALGTLELQQSYFSHPQSHLLIHRLMEVRDASGVVLYRSDALDGQSFGGLTLAGEGEMSFNEREVRLADGTPVLLISHTHPVQGRMLLIRLGYSMAPFRERMRQFLVVLVIALPGTLLLIGLGGYFTTRRGLRPLESMAARAETISSRNLSERIDISNPDDELGHMGRVLNLLLERLDRSFMQLQRFTADAAHELRTPLASIRSVGELALQSDSHDVLTYREALSSMLEEAAVLNQTVGDLLLLARTEAAEPRLSRSTFSLFEVVSEVLGVLEVLLEDSRLSVTQEGRGEDTEVSGDRGLVRIALINVLHNAVKFSPPGTAICIRYGLEGQASATLSVEDEGQGIQAGEHSAVFERFFVSPSQSDSGHTGSGIGLSVAKVAIERNGGEIYFVEGVSRGAHCVIKLPLATAAGINEATATRV